MQREFGSFCSKRLTCRPDCLLPNLRKNVIFLFLSVYSAIAVWCHRRRNHGLCLLGHNVAHIFVPGSVLLEFHQYLVMYVF
jgi:hypothetical protein